MGMTFFPCATTVCHMTELQEAQLVTVHVPSIHKRGFRFLSIGELSSFFPFFRVLLHVYHVQPLKNSDAASQYQNCY